MDVTNIGNAKEWFEVLQTTECTQTAMMTLKPGDASGSEAEAHENSDQVLLVLDGELIGEVGSERPRLKRGDVIVIEAGTKHRFANATDKPAVTFNVYSPPAYPADTKG
ncbi:MAG: Cupin 2 conserved barrel domain protein [Spartobacteria bacterium]|nr:Cupin 2 conserved barrel domain protein [Spartobacteria bacterium]